MSLSTREPPVGQDDPGEPTSIGDDRDAGIHSEDNQGTGVQHTVVEEGREEHKQASPSAGKEDYEIKKQLISAEYRCDDLFPGGLL